MRCLDYPADIALYTYFFWDNLLSFLIVQNVNSRNTDSSPVLHNIFVMLSSMGNDTDMPYNVAKSKVYWSMVLIS